MLTKKKTRQSKKSNYSQQILPLHGKTLSLRWLNSTQVLGSSQGDRQQERAAWTREGGRFLRSPMRSRAILGRGQAYPRHYCYGAWLPSILWSRWASVCLLFVMSVLTHKDRMPWEHLLVQQGLWLQVPPVCGVRCAGGHPRMASLCYCLSNGETEAQRGQVVRLRQT